MSLKASQAPVVTLIKGGLGNQMFCYAAGRALAQRLGREFQLDTHTAFVGEVYGRSYRLNRFPIIAAEADPKLCLGGRIDALPHKLARALSKFSKPENRLYVAERKSSSPADMDRLSPPAGKPLYLNGYWQEEGYFGEHSEGLRKELAPPVPTSEAGLEARRMILSAPVPVMVHIRREKYPRRLGSNYYNDSISACLAEFPNAAFFVFGDDFEWAREHIVFEGSPVRYLDRVGADEIEDLHLMTCCRHAIVANSTFSWWGAWLGHHAGQRVWTPAEPGWPVKPAAGWTPVPNDLECD